jgi:hypothetical protein
MVDLGADEDGKPVRTVVMDWTHGTTAAEAPAPDDPWIAGCRQDNQKAVMSRLKRVLLAVLAEHGTERPIPSETHVRNSPPIGDEFRTPVLDAPVVRLVDQQLVREAFARCTPEDPRQTIHDRFKTARDRAEHLGLIGIGNIDGATFLWLTRLEPEDDQELD